MKLLLANLILKGTLGNKINALMAAAFNFKKRMSLKGLYSVFTFLRIFIAHTSLDIKINESAQSKLLAYFRLLLNKNEQINLISPKQDIKTKVIIHLVDSFTLLITRCSGYTHKKKIGFS